VNSTTETIVQKTAPVELVALRQALAQGVPWTEELIESLIPRPEV
jgi:hypothetical protein